MKPVKYAATEIFMTCLAILGYNLEVVMQVVKWNYG